MLNRYSFNDLFHVVIPPLLILFSFHSCNFLGKFGERINKATTVTVKDPLHLFSLLYDAALDVNTLRLCTDDILRAVYTSVHDNAVKSTKTNIFVAVFTTCHATHKLY